MPTDLPDACVTGGTLSVDLELTDAPPLLLPAVGITVTPVRVRLTYGRFDEDAFVAVRVEGRDARGFVDYYDFNRRADWPQWLVALVGEHRPAARDALVRTAALTEAGVALAARHCCPESVDLVHHMINHQLCPDCEGYGQTVTDMPDGGIIRRCRTCNRAGLVPLAATAPTSQEK